MQATRLFSLLVKVVLGLGLNMLVVVTATAEQVYIGLRNGPSDAFPVIYEVTPYRQLDVILRRGDWVKATDGRSSGWLHVDDLHLLETFPRDTLWKLVNETRPGPYRLEFSTSSLQSFSVGGLFPVFDQSLFARYSRAPKGDTSWSLAQAGWLNEFARPTDELTFSWSGAIGYAQDQQGSEFWSSEQEPVWTGILGVEAMWQADRYFELGARGEAATTLNNDMTTHRSVSLIWRLRL